MRFYSGYNGSESFEESQLLNRGVTQEQQQEKMRNLIRLAKEGFRKVKMIEHDCYEVEGKKGLYNPYTDTFLKGR